MSNNSRFLGQVMNENEKLIHLQQTIRRYDSIAVAFSGGVNSAFLIKVALDMLGEKAIAVTARSSTYPVQELDEAKKFAKSIGVRHIVFESEELEIPNFSENQRNRCYFCKQELFRKIWKIANELGIDTVAGGSNADDTYDYVPGKLALMELGVESPLQIAELNKKEITFLSKEMGLPTWDKQPLTCLASRIPYGQQITREKLQLVADSK